MPIIECVPNISEGRRPDVVDRVAAAIRAVPGVHLLDVQSDASHNRSVLTFVADRGAAARGGAPALRRGAGRDRSARPCRRASAPRRGGRLPVRSHRRRDDGRLRGAGAGNRRRRSRRASICRYTSTRTRRPTRRGATSRTSVAANSRGWPRRCAARPGVPTSGRRRRTPARARRFSGRACRSSPTTSTSPPTGSTWPERSPRPSA